MSAQLHNNAQLAKQIKCWGRELGFQQIAITNTDLTNYEAHLTSWLQQQYHGEMVYMTKHGNKRSRPNELMPGTKTIIMARMNYLPPQTDTINILQNANKAYISRYALGRDYHKLIRKRLTQLAKHITQQAPDFNYRAFADSAPVMEKPLAAKAGLGWIGKNTLLLNRDAGSWFFLGTLYTDLELPLDQPITEHCGNCQACIKVCPTQAIIAPYKLDARRCISYLTIELRGSIPIELRPLIGNRIFGCDDCQLVCPWNRFAKFTHEQDFHPRHQLDNADLIRLFAWNEDQFLKNTEGSAIRRAGYTGWLRNIAVALGNAPTNQEVIQALQNRAHYPNDIVREHVQWALAQHVSK